MEMTLRWYGQKHDNFKTNTTNSRGKRSNYIVGDVWEIEDIQKMIDEVEASGLHIYGIESVNIHDAIKTGSKERDYCIDNYIKT